MLIDTLGIVIYNSLLVFDLYFIEKKKINYKNKNFYIALLFVNILTLLNVHFAAIQIKPFINILILIIADWIIIKNKAINSIIKVIIMYTLFLIVELIYTLFVILIFDAFTIEKLNDVMNGINNMYLYSFLSNTIFSIIFYMIFNTRIFNIIYIKVVSLVSRLTERKSLLNFCALFLFAYFTYAIFSFSDKIVLNVIMLIVLLLIIAVIYLKGINVGNQFAEEKEKYSSNQQLLVEYEEMIDRYRVNNHENKNQLLTIQNMIKNKDKTVNEYIDDLVGNVYMTNEKTMMTVSIIPAKGLRATIHTKLNIMDNKKIDYALNVDRKLRVVDFDSINSELNLKICKIISIFIDNAIDEVENHKKDKFINMELYVIDKVMMLEISNRFENHFDITKITDKKYTTKENGHGYGLALAKELIDSEKALINETRIDDDIFTQILQIKLKK